MRADRFGVGGVSRREIRAEQYCQFNVCVTLLTVSASRQVIDTSRPERPGSFTGVKG